MAKRALITLLWFYSMWFLGAATAYVLGISGALGPILGISAGVIVAIDPRRIIWTARASRPAAIGAGSVNALPSGG
jgi:hypothetical protein